MFIKTVSISKFNKRYYTYCYLKVIHTSFNYGKNEKGGKYLARFDKVIEENSSIVLNEQYIESAFSEIAAYYVRRRNYYKALKYLNKGLELVPNSIELNQRMNNIKAYKKDIEDYDKISSVITPSIPEEDFKEVFYSNFPNCWIAKSIIEDTKLIDMPQDEKIEIIASKHYKVEFKYNNETQKGRWAIRPKSKLLYLIPEKNEKDYLIFKVIEISDDLLKIRPYENKKLIPIIIIMESCNN